jgi:outer membrane protein assembly factor BamB
MNSIDWLRGRWLAGFIVSMLASPALADNWPTWRGPTYDGISKESSLPADWSATQNIAWKVTLPGPGGSTPIVWGERVFLTSEDGEAVVLLCISTEGKELWKRPFGKVGRHYRNDEGTNASATPSTDGQHVYVFCGSGEFACFDFQGKEVWKFDAQERYGRFQTGWGTHTSPLLHGDRLYLQLLHSGAAWVIALDKSTGKEIWKIERKSDARRECKDSYATPCIWQGANEAYLITHGADYAIAHRLTDGSEIWRLGELNSSKRYNPTLRLVSSPLATPDLIIIPSAKKGPVVAVKPDAKGTVGPGSPFEQWRIPKNTPDVPSPILYDGLVYLCGEYGSLTCLDAKTGKEIYNEPLHQTRYRASPVCGDGKVYLTARDGTITVVKSGPDYKVLAVNKLPDQVAASLAIADVRIYVRGFNALYAIEKGTATSKR